MTEQAVMLDTQDRDAAEAEALDRAVVKAREAVAAGRVVPHERVRGWLVDLIRGQRKPRPR